MNENQNTSIDASSFTCRTIGIMCRVSRELPEDASVCTVPQVWHRRVARFIGNVLRRNKR